MKVPGRILTADDIRALEGIEPLLMQSAEFIDLVLAHRSRLLPTEQLRFVIVDSDAHRASIAEWPGGWLIAVTTGLIRSLQICFLQLTYTSGFHDFFGLPGTRFVFARSPEGRISWIDLLLTSPTPEPTREQFAAGAELGRLALALLINHEVGHAVHNHFGAIGGAKGAFSEGFATESLEVRSAYERQCLEVDADGFGIGTTLVDCLAGVYPPTVNGVLTEERWTGSLVAYDVESATRSVIFTNLLLWSFLERDQPADDAWTGNHPPPLYRCLATIEVLRATLKATERLQHLGAPEVDVEALGLEYGKTVEAYAGIMDELGSDVARRIGDLRRDRMDSHTALLMDAWQIVRERLPKYQGRPFGGDSPSRRPAASN